MAFSLNFDDNKLSTSVWPPLPTLDDKKSEVNKKINYITSVNILKGFDYEFKGTTYHFSFDNEDQSNFTQEQIRATKAVADGKKDSYVAYWRGHTADGAVTLQFNYDEFIDLLMFAGQNKSTQLGTGWVLKDKIAACTTKAEVEEMTKTLKIDELERAARDIVDELGLSIKIEDM